ncbi:protein kinase family protein [Siccirubricoccus phaeus]|uniref:hypothetical protein n=1 Tax=Siccirubricoccus phaeus TaxID=2595053 RepID=UPI0011F376BB|nr:hypothetical protein [Siccirubricoccus phaeus]
MSQTVNAPPRPQRPTPNLNRRQMLQQNHRQRLLPAQLDAWRVEMFRELGWSSKQEAQTGMFEEMQGYCEGVEATVLPNDPANNPYVSANLDEKKLKAGKEFKAYIAALKAFEDAGIPRDMALVQALREAAQGYLDHFAKHSRLQQRDKINRHKRDVCLNTLAELKKYEVREQLDALGPPPWQSAKAMEAASLKATLDLESLPRDKKAQNLSGTHAFPAFWITQDVEGQDEPVKTFLFKPATTEKASGIPSGGTAPREAAANRAADLFGAMTGLSFDMPETNIIAMSKARLPEGGLEGVIGGDDESRPDVVGSLQKVAENQGGLRGQSLSAREEIPPEEVQKVILLDMAVLNLDRHADNMLAQRQQDGSTRLIPIDHGLSLPGFAAAKDGTIADKLGNPNFTATLSLPGAHQPFSQEMLAAIAKLQPDTFAKAMKAEIGAIGDAHPSTRGQISDEAVEMSRRSLMFLKLGAPQLTAAALQTAFGQNAALLLDPAIDDREFARRALQVINQAAAQQDGLRELMQMSPEERAKVGDALKANGWDFYKDEFVLKQPKTALAYYHGNVLNPAKLAACEQALGKAEVTAWLKAISLQSLFADRNAIAAGSKARMDQAGQSDYQLVLADFPNFKPVPGKEGDGLAAWRALQPLGGLNAMEAAIQTLQLSDRDAGYTRDAPTLALERVRLAAGFTGLGDQEKQELALAKQAFPQPPLRDGDVLGAAEELPRWRRFLQLGGEQAYQTAMDGLKRPRATGLTDAIDTIESFARLPQPSQQDLADIDAMRQAFPNEKTFDQAPLTALASLAAWRELEQLGGLQKLDQVLAAVIGGAPRPDSVRKALEIVQGAKAHEDATAGLGQMDLHLPALQAELAYVKSLLPRLANGSQMPGKVTLFEQAIPQDRAAARKALHALKLEVMDELLLAFKALIKAIEDRLDRYKIIAMGTDDPEVGYIEEDFAEPRANILAGVFTNAEALLRQFEDRLDNWAAQQDPNPG